MFFFFFNQKTAYELRISDWSSDVCSSDLLVGNIKSGDWLGALQSVLDIVGQVAGIIKGTGTPAVRTFSLDGARAAGGSVMPNGNYLVGERGPEILQMGGRGGSIVPNNQKIGRASCRERVCQYV